MSDRQAIQQKALQLLSRREYSVRELQRKLSTDHPSETVDDVLETLRQQGLQSDERFAEVWTRHRFLQGYGPLRIQMELRQKGVSSDLIRLMLEQDTFDWFEQAKAVYERRFSGQRIKDARERAKQMRFLQQRGFSSDQIRFALETVE